ncbi:relaxin-3-like [Carassius carassius]|uniref:relaxin-3-like n=1 Tax=Carassius carassius TaxID=217509 RepID=UPI0028687518|nr:relaxin-3-like [Carassius carassius]
MEILQYSAGQYLCNLDYLQLSHSACWATDGQPMYSREFIRAVIFTCGGSRCRRSLDVSGDLSSDLLSAHDPIVPGLSYRPRPDAEAPVWTGEGPEDHVFISEEVLEASRSSARKGRGVVVELSNASCK